MKRLLVIEDGDEYVEFARLFLAADFVVAPRERRAAALAALRERRRRRAAHRSALRSRRPRRSSAMSTATAARLFGGDRGARAALLQDQQGTLILGALRAAGYASRRCSCTTSRRAASRTCAGSTARVDAVPTFDAAAIRRGACSEAAR